MQLWQAVAASASAIAALVALFVAYLNYRARPLLVKAIEVHSQKLQQEILPRFLNELPMYERYRSIDRYDLGRCSFPQKSLAIIESSPLFRDLAYHVLPGLDPLRLWDQYKNDWDQLDQARSELAIKVRYVVEQDARAVNLAVGAKAMNVITEDVFIPAFYQAIVDLRRALGGPYETMQQDSASLGIKSFSSSEFCVTAFRNGSGGSSTTWAIVDNQNGALRAKKLLQDLVNHLPESILAEACILCKRADKVQEIRKKIQEDIETLMALPVLPNSRCPVLRMAEDPIMPRCPARLGRVVTSAWKRFFTF